MKFADLVRGQQVEYELGENGKGVCAKRVRSSRAPVPHNRALQQWHGACAPPLNARSFDGQRARSPDAVFQSGVGMLSSDHATGEEDRRGPSRAASG